MSRVNVRTGVATGVEYVDAAGGTHAETARVVVLAAGAIETPRLLLLSGVEHPLVGRHLMCHFQTIVMGGLAQRVHPDRGRSVTHVHDDHLVPDDSARRAARAAGLQWFRGGMVEHCGPAGPILEAKLYPWGEAHARSMRDSPLRDRMWGFTMQGEDMPQVGNRVDLDPSVRDVRGFPVARITYDSHSFERAASAHYGPRLAACDGDQPGRFRPFRRVHLARAQQQARDGHDAHGHRSGDVGRRRPWPRPRCPEHRGGRLVGVRDGQRLRPDAHARRTGPTGGTSSRQLGAGQLADDRQHRLVVPACEDDVLGAEPERSGHDPTDRSRSLTLQSGSWRGVRAVCALGTRRGGQGIPVLFSPARRLRQ